MNYQTQAELQQTRTITSAPTQRKSRFGAPKYSMLSDPLIAHIYEAISRITLPTGCNNRGHWPHSTALSHSSIFLAMTFVFLCECTRAEQYRCFAEHSLHENTLNIFRWHSRYDSSSCLPFLLARKDSLCQTICLIMCCLDSMSNNLFNYVLVKPQHACVSVFSPFISWTPPYLLSPGRPL